jgi:dTDP-glucose 4,6-dehydratase
MAEKFLIVGASSFYGRNFAELVRARGDQVTEISLRSWMPQQIAEAQPNYIVNFAAANVVAESWDVPSLYLNTNVLQHQSLLNVILDRPVVPYIHVSTPEVYGSRKGWIAENQRFAPSTPYAVSRAATDMMLAAYHKALGFPAIITRTANLYGPGQQEHRIIPKAFATLRSGGKLKLEGDGNSIRGFIHVRDACEATYRVCKQGVPGETYHIATKHVLTIQQLVKMICEMVGKKYGDCVESAPDRLGKDYCYMLDSAKVRALGWTDKIRITEGLAEYAAWSGNRPTS